MKLTYNEFKSNPILYILFLPLVAMVSLFLILKNHHEDQIKDKNKQIEKVEIKQNKTDSINHNLYELLGAKRIIDSLKIK